MNLIHERLHITQSIMKNTYSFGIIWYSYHNWQAKSCLWEWHQETILHLLKWDILILPKYKADVQPGIGKNKKKKLAIRDKWCQIQLEVMECRQMGIPMGRKYGKIFQRSSEKNESEAKAIKGNKWSTQLLLFLFSFSNRRWILKSQKQTCRKLLRGNPWAVGV